MLLDEVLVDVVDFLVFHAVFVDGLEEGAFFEGVPLVFFQDFSGVVVLKVNLSVN